MHEFSQSTSYDEDAAGCRRQSPELKEGIPPRPVVKSGQFTIVLQAERDVMSLAVADGRRNGAGFILNHVKAKDFLQVEDRYNNLRLPNPKRQPSGRPMTPTSENATYWYLSGFTRR